MRFHGEYQHTVDAKGRVSLPAKFRKALPEELIVVPGFHGALSVFPEEAFDAWVDSFFRKEDGTDGYNPKSSKDIVLRKKLNANAENVTVDAAGRITISSKKRAAAGIAKDVYIIGDNDHIEIWPADAYEEQMSDFSLDEFLEG